MSRKANPDPMSTILLSSAVGGAAMQVGAVLAGKLFSEREKNPGWDEEPDDDNSDQPSMTGRCWSCHDRITAEDPAVRVMVGPSTDDVYVVHKSCRAGILRAVKGNPAVSTKLLKNKLLR